MMSQLNKAGDLARCGLVALALARQNGIVQSRRRSSVSGPLVGHRPEYTRFRQVWDENWHEFQCEMNDGSP